MPIEDVKFVDMGSGFGARLQSTECFGAHPANLYGVGLSEERAAIAKEISQNMNLMAIMLKSFADLLLKLSRMTREN